MSIGVRAVAGAVKATADVRMRDVARVRILPVDAVQAGIHLTGRAITPARWAVPSAMTSPSERRSP
ncbi:hypothetical protein OG900_20115 [Streptomyces sp. NBC_00433]